MAAEVRVRLTAEGVAEVVAALQKVRAAGQDVARTGASEFGAMNGVLAASDALFANLAAAVSVGALLNFALQATEAAKALEDAAIGAGTTIPRLQALSAIARRNGVDFTTFNNSLGFFERNLRNLQDGVPAAEKAFGRLGLSAKSFAGLDTAQGFDLVAHKIAALPDSFNKTALVMDLVGRRGRALVATFDEVGRTGSLDELVEEYKRLGLVLDEDVVNSAARVKTIMEEMQTQVQNAGIAFLAGFAPALQQANKALNEGDVKSATDDWVNLGRTIGTVFKSIAVAAIIGADIVETALEHIGTGIAAIGVAGVEALQGRLDKSIKALLLGQKIVNDDNELFVQRNIKRLQDISDNSFAPTNANAALLGSGTGTGSGTGGDADEAAKKRLALAKQTAENELELARALAKNEEEAEGTRFKEGLISVEQYYDARVDLARRATAAEVKSIDARIKAEKDAGKLSDPAAVAKLVGSREVAEVQLAGKLHQLAVERVAEEKKLSDARQATALKIGALEDRNHLTRLEEINAEVTAYGILLGQEGATLDAQIAGMAELDRALRSAEQFESQAKLFAKDESSLGAQRARIQDAINSGAESELSGRKQILAIEQASIPTLQRVADLAYQAAVASSDPVRIQQALAFQQKVDGLGVSISESTKLMNNFGGAAAQAINQSLTSSLANGVRGFKNLGQAGVAAIASIIQALEQLAAQIISTEVLQFLHILPSGVPGTSIAPNPGVALPDGYASGGLLRGPGTGTSDSILMRGSTGEFMVRERVVSQPGMLALLETINAGIMPASLAAAPLPRFAEGGMVGAPSSAHIDGQVTVTLEDGLVHRQLDTPAGERTLLRILSRRARAVNKALGR